MTFLDAYNQYLKYIEISLKSQSVASIKQSFNTHILKYFRNYNLKDINVNDVLDFQKYLFNLKLSSNYFGRIYMSLCRFIDFCISCGYLENNLFRKLKNFKIVKKRKEIDFYTLDEFNQFIQYVDNKIYQFFFEFMFFTGCRPGEAMALKFSDFKNNCISINKDISEHCVDGDRVISTPKNNSSIRIISLSNNIIKELVFLNQFYNKKYHKKDNYYIFGGLKPLSPTTINRYKKNACKKANIRPITLHQFRHSHATLLIEKDIPINAISKRLGHSNITTTFNIYIHNSFENEKRVLDTLNSLF